MFFEMNDVHKTRWWRHEPVWYYAMILTIKWKITQNGWDNRLKLSLEAPSCKVWSLEWMFVSHRLYNVNVFSCITVLGALLQCCLLHLWLIHHLKYWYVIDINIYIDIYLEYFILCILNPHVYQYYNKIFSGAIYKKIYNISSVI